MACPSVLSNYLINKLLKHITNQAIFTPPATIYLALYTSSPNVDNSGTEVSGNNYARQAISWASIVLGTSVANTNTLTFPTATGTWGAVTYLALMDSVSGGNLLAFTPASQTITVTAGTNYVISPSALTFSLQ